ncbi:unnamed protein product [Caenorhabditis bovis]|uniref:Transforming acidic coiled-coil-containing protein C-terminal domain-containing protein n=1 Tax=Caenorhabditis bovis TaxID=2654633 RepID=A0A8S1FAJ2_9PELO|nr:unnamed protein product [Caenorhabditis bovis]
MSAEEANRTMTIEDPPAEIVEQVQQISTIPTDIENNVAVRQLLADANISDVTLLKHLSTIQSNLLSKLLESDDYEVRRIRDNKIISKGRLSGFGLNNGGANGAMVDSEELQRALRERDQARIEAEKIHENYANLYNSYNIVRESANDIRSAYDDVSSKLKAAVAEIEEWQGKYAHVRENAQAELERASREYDELVRSHEDNTKNLRLLVKKQEIEMSGKNEELELLKKGNRELRQIIDQLMPDVDVSDAESSMSTSAI